MKYIQLACAALAGLALAAPQSRPTREEYYDKAPMTPQRVLEIYGDSVIECTDNDKLFPGKISCKIPAYMTAAPDPDVKPEDGLSPLCKRRNGCKDCRFNDDGNFLRNANHILCDSCDDIRRTALDKCNEAKSDFNTCDKKGQDAFFKCQASL